jgi:hypothetical protein
MVTLRPMSHPRILGLLASGALVLGAATCADRERIGFGDDDGGAGSGAGNGGSCEGPVCAPGCCREGQQCCAYDGGNVCRDAAEPCPVGCTGGASQCEAGEYCQLDPRSNVPICVDHCADGAVCGDGVCCPLGSKCVDGACALADLAVDSTFLGGNVFVQKRTFEAGACEIVEGCVLAPGERTLLTFPLKSPNLGPGDLWLGTPDPTNGLFEFSGCHGHYHFTGYVAYRLLDGDGKLVAPGRKQAFCLLDTTPVLPDAPVDALYDCENQGIQRGWADVYAVGLPCQWIDVTGVPLGNYVLEVEINPDRVIAESRYDDNTYQVPVTIGASTCPNGCLPYDESCCKAGNPCGLTGNGSCDCADRFGWDAADCAACWFDDPACFPGYNSCPGACTPGGGNCCSADDPCNLHDNGSCDCAGAFEWEMNDCSNCASPDPDCPGN